MQETKPWYLSKTIWAAVVSVLATIATFFGYPTDEALRQSITNGILQFVAALAGMVAIFGRLAASTKIV